MKNTTRKLSGPTKDRFLKRFFCEEPDLDEATANRLAEKSSKAFSSLRIRTHVRAISPGTPQRPIANPTAPKKVASPNKPEQAKAETKQSEPAKQPEIKPAPEPLAKAQPAPAKPDHAQQAPNDAPAIPFDPYEIGLVPTLQREGADGLMAKLKAIASADNLRAMAKVQQIVLPRDIRTGDPTPETVRDAIVAAVTKRVSDRRSAAS